MAQKTIKLPNGQQVTVNVPDGATNDQILRFVKREYDAGRIGQQQAPQPAQVADQPVEQPVTPQMQQAQPEAQPEPSATPFEGVVAGLENAMSGLTAVPASIIGGWSGILSAPFVGLDEAGNVAEKAADFFTYSPRSDLGKEVQQQTAEALQPVAEWMVDRPGDLMFDIANNPNFKAAAYANQNQPALRALADNPDIAGTVGASFIPVALEMMGVKWLSKAKTAGQARKAIAQEIADGNVNIDNVINTLDANGRLIRNPNVKSAISMLGDDVKGKHAAILFEQMSGATKKQVNRMLDVVQEARKRGPSYIMENRPANIIGESITDRVRTLNRERKRANRMLDDVVNNRMQGKQIEIGGAANQFMNELSETGIRFGRNDKGRITVDLSNARARLGDVLPKTELERILNQLDSNTMSAKKAHQFKQFMREFVDYGDGLQVGAKTSKKIEDALKNLSSNINQELGLLDPQYAKANQIWADTGNVLKKVGKSLGDINLESELASSKLGALSKRIGSNLQSRDQIIGMVNELDEALAKRKIFPKDDIKMQVAALSNIEDIFGLEPMQSPFSFQSRIQKAAAGQGVGSQVLDEALDKLKQWREPDFNDRMRALRKMAEVKKDG